jgi:hypothetical protein
MYKTSRTSPLYQLPFVLSLHFPYNLNLNSYSQLQLPFDPHPLLNSTPSSNRCRLRPASKVRALRRLQTHADLALLRVLGQATRTLVRGSRRRSVDGPAERACGVGSGDALAAQEHVGPGLAIRAGSCCDQCVKKIIKVINYI